MLKFFALMVLTISAANAQTLLPLQHPADIPLARSTCDVGSFNADDTAYGTCNLTHPNICSGHAVGCGATVYVYATVWDLTGKVVQDVLCGTAHTYAARPATWVYEPGFDASTCYFPPYPQGATVLIGNYWYHVGPVATDGSREYLYGQAGAYIGVF